MKKTNITNPEKITKSLNILGLSAVFLRFKITPQTVLYYYNLENIKDLHRLKKALLPLSALLRENVKTVEQNEADFCLEINRQDRAFINYNDIYKILENKPNFEFLLGVDCNNNILTYNLNECPHILIAGATGSGKSVFLNTILWSFLLYSKNWGCILIDTKKVEFSPYKNIKQNLTNIITDYKQAINTLSFLCEEMNNRYIYLEKQGQKNNDAGTFPKIIVFVDELADLMLASKKEVEPLLVRLAQMGRAAGIHLILATQRPTVNVVTGLLKANISMRVGFAMASMRDSMVLLDYSGANKLLGKGDALIKYPNKIETVRVQAPFLDNETINNVLNNINTKTNGQKKKNKLKNLFKINWFSRFINFLQIKRVNYLYKKRKITKQKYLLTIEKLNDINLIIDDDND